MVLEHALKTVHSQNFSNFEVLLVNDGAAEQISKLLLYWQDKLPLKIIQHKKSIGISFGRQEALWQSAGEYIAFLDDDDEWIDPEKQRKQSEYLDSHPEVVMVGGAMLGSGPAGEISYRFRPERDQQIRVSFLFQNNFFTSTVMFRRQKAIEAGGFIKDNLDLAEDYDLWLRMGKLGKFYNFQEAFTKYTQPSYNKAKFRQFLQKQLTLIGRHKKDYPGFWLASLTLRFRILFGF